AARPPGRRDAPAGRRVESARLQGGGDRRTIGPGPADCSSQDPPHPKSLAGGGPPMNGDQPPGTGSAPLSLQKRVNKVCDRFEKAWKDGQRPRIEEYLAEVPDPDRVPLFRELLALEIELRCNGSETPTPEEYHQRFGEHIELIQAVFADSPCDA